MQFTKVEICGVDTSSLKVLKEKEKIAFKLQDMLEKGEIEPNISGRQELIENVMNRFIF